MVILRGRRGRGGLWIGYEYMTASFDFLHILDIMVLVLENF